MSQARLYIAKRERHVNTMISIFQQQLLECTMLFHLLINLVLNFGICTIPYPPPPLGAISSSGAQLSQI